MVWHLALAVAAVTSSNPAHDTLAHAPAIVPSPVSAAALLESETRRVRAMNGPAARLLADGVRRSRTFAALISAIQETDVIVYVESTSNLPATMGGRLQLQAVTDGERYLRVQVLASLRHNQAIEVLAHELRHVLEVAAERSVVDQAGMVALYQRIGFPTFGARGYDTVAARRTGDTVRRELRG